LSVVERKQSLALANDDARIIVRMEEQLGRILVSIAAWNGAKFVTYNFFETDAVLRGIYMSPNL